MSSNKINLGDNLFLSTEVNKTGVTTESYLLDGFMLHRTDGPAVTITQPSGEKEYQFFIGNSQVVEQGFVNFMDKKLNSNPDISPEDKIDMSAQLQNTHDRVYGLVVEKRKALQY